MGDFFIKKLIDNPHIFGISTHLIHLILKCFYKLLWDKKHNLNHKLLLEVLVGEFDPKLFVEVSSIKQVVHVVIQCEISGILPKTLSKIKDFQTIVYSESASHYRRREMAKFANRYFNENYSQTIDKLDYHSMQSFTQLSS